MSRAARGRARVVAKGLAGLLAATLLLQASCALRLAGRHETVDALRISDVVAEGDAQRRASNRILVSGLEADEQHDPDRALGRYEEALRIDPNNPYAYLAIARHHAEGADPMWALSFLDKADSLFRAEGGPSPRVQPHLVGLRGQVLYASGDTDGGLLLLEEAWTVAPDVWSDGRLTADELQ